MGSYYFSTIRFLVVFEQFLRDFVIVENCCKNLILLLMCSVKDASCGCAVVTTVLDIDSLLVGLESGGGKLLVPRSDFHLESPIYR